VDEDDADLTEFANWHSEFTLEMFKQHSLARTEMEAQNTLASYSARLVEHAITENQSRVESLISSILVCMKTAIDSTKTMDQARKLMANFPLQRIFGLFNPKSRRVGTVICHALDIIIAYAATDQRRRAQESQTTVDTGDDSQEYGDWSGFAEICGQQMRDVPAGVSHIDSDLRPPLSQFVSRCFAEDHVPDDSVLLKAIDSWTSIGLVLVRHDLRQWSSYLNPHDQDSWASLRSTDQTRRFTPQFLATIVQKGPSAYTEWQTPFLASWAASLVERGSMMKYQHRLTNVLLDEDGDNPLFKNLPFSANRASGRYEISLDELCQRRVSLISCLLSNMREHVFELEQRGEETNAVLGNYREIASALMTAMKRNYEELGNGRDPVRGSYVEFVHRVVEFLQQHSQGICPLDPFFTDPTSFPLPVSDPTYIVAKLKSYGVRLGTAKAAKPLVTFIQNVSERAAVDNQQEYLVDQLYNAMSHTAEPGNPQQPTLRRFLLQCVVPAYVELCFANPCVWILVRPFLQATSRMFADLILDIDFSTLQNANHVVDSMRTYFDSIDCPFQLLIDRPDLLEQPPILSTVTNIVETITSSLAVIDYIDRVSPDSTVLQAYVERFRQFTLFAVSSLLDSAAALAPDPLDSLLHKYEVSYDHSHRTTVPSYYPEVRNFASRELKSWLRDGWSVHDGKYFISRKQQVNEVHVDPSCHSEEVSKTAFVHAVEVFFGAMAALDM
jgi:hypothetical protein